MQPKVYFTIIRPYTAPEIFEAVIDTSSVIDSGIEVGEYVKVLVKVVSPDNNTPVTLKIETCGSEEVMEVTNSDGDLILMSGENSDHMLVPGLYPFEVTMGDNKYYSYYKVLSKDFSNDSLLNLRKYLERLLKGLSYDLVKQRLGMAIPVSDMNPSLLQLFQFIDKNKRHIKKNLEKVLEDPLTDLKGQYKIRENTRRPDSKSFRWQAQKSVHQHSLYQAPRFYYEKHTQLTRRNVENQWVKYIVKYFLHSLRKLEVSFQKEINQVVKKIESQEKFLLQNQRQMQLGSQSFGYKKTVEELKKAKKRFESRIVELKDEKKVYDNYKQFIRQITFLFTKYENTEWLQEISIQKPKKVSQRMLKDHRYRKLYSLYNELTHLETKHVESSIPGIQFRKTWQLFEYYSVGIVIDILRDNGYIWTEGWLASKDSPHQHIGTLPQDTILKFEKTNSDHYIEVAYDTELESSILDTTYSRYFNNAGRRPDIRVTIYRSDGSLYSEKSGLIIEVKCRRHYYLINQDIDPDIKLQLRDFMRLEYYDSTASQQGGAPVKMPIKQVIVLYPKQNGMAPVKNDHVYGESMVYIQIEPSDPLSEAKPFGYDQLHRKVVHFLSQIEEEDELND